MEQSSKLFSFVNQDRGSTLARGVPLAGTSRQRRRGLLDLTSWTNYPGLWIVPCEAIHTFGMKVPLDSVFLDRQLRVRALRPALKPWRFAVCLRAHSVLELPLGAIESSGTCLGNQLVVSSISGSQPLSA